MPASDLAIPILPSRSFAATLDFYGRLGFAGEIKSADYAILRRGAVELHFFAHPSLHPASSHAGCYIRVTDVDAWHRSFQSAALPALGIPRMEPVEDKPWGLREFALLDEDGNLLRVGQIL